MKKYRVTRCVMVWKDAVVEAADEDAAIDAAYAADAWETVDSDTQDITVEEE